MNRTRLSRPFRLLAVSSIALTRLLAGSPAHAGSTPLLRKTEIYEAGAISFNQNNLTVADFNLDGHKDFVVQDDNDHLAFIRHRSMSASIFDTPVTTPSNAPLVNLAAADFNGDGKPDVATLWSGNAGLGIGLWRVGPSGFMSHIKDYSFSSPYSLSSSAELIAADLNQDGRPDLVAGFQPSIAIFLGAAPDSLTPSFETLDPLGHGPMTVADATNDGIPDIVVFSMGGLWILKGAGDGTFHTHLGPFAVPETPYDGRPRVAQLNGDGIPDMAISTYSSDPNHKHLQIYYGTGGGSFLAPTSANLGNLANALVMGDLDNDGDTDVVSVDYFGSLTLNMAVVRNNGNGTFAAPVNIGHFPASESGVGQGVLVDINEDGWLDYVAPTTYHTLGVLLNDGAGGFLTSNITALTSNANALAISDFNRDGRPDLISAEDNGQDVLVAAGNADGTFQPGATIPIGSTIHAVAMGDMNRDGNDDLVVAAGDLSFFQGDGLGQFQPQGFFPGNVMALSIADMNRDGKPDVVVGDGSTYSVYVQSPGQDWSFFPGQPFAPGSYQNFALGDWNRDGIPDVAFYGLSGIETVLCDGTGGLNGPVTVVQSGRKYTSLCLGDFNRDGTTDIAAREDATGITGTRGADVFFGDGLGGFSPAKSYAFLEPKGYAIQSWDANFDGLPDLVASSTQQNSSLFSSMDFLLGDAGPFGLRSSYTLNPLRQTFDGVQAFAFGDVNRDGGMDILAARPGYIETTLGIPPSFGTGIQNAATYATLTDPGCVVLGDVNRDGILDAVASTVETAPGIAVSLGRTGGTLAAGVSLSQSWNSSRVALADMNRDGKLDIVASNYGFGLPRISTMLGAGDGTFGPRNDRFINAGNDFDIGDMDRDGIPDVVTSETDSICVLKGTGSGTLVPLPIARVAITPVYDLDVADLNRDGYLDVVCAGGSVKILYGGPGGTLAAPVTLAGPIACQTVCVADVNRDGYPDIIANDSSTYYVFRGAAVNPFSTSQVTTLTFAAFDLQVGAAAGNGQPYVYALRNPSTLELLSVSAVGALTDVGSAGTLAQPSALALGDMNRDGVVDAVSVSQFASSIAVNLHGLGLLTAVEDTPPPAPLVETLAQNYPNPFNPETTIRYSLPVSERVRLDVYDPQGRWVVRLEDGNEMAGEHRAKWNGRTRQGSQAASGVYFYRLTTSSGHSESKAMVLLK